MYINSLVECSKKSTTQYRQILRSESGGGGELFRTHGKRIGKFFISENMNFLVIFRYLQISFAVKSYGVDQVLTKILQIDQKLTFNIFHILK